MKFTLELLLLIVIYSHPSHAQWATAIIQDLSTNSKSTVSPKIGFVTTEDSVKTLISTVTIPFNDNSKARSIKGNAIVFKPEWQKSPGQAVIGLGAINTELTIESENNKSFSYKIKLQLKSPKIIESGCKKLGITVSKNDLAKLPIFMGVQCEKNKKQELVHISVPEEIAWESTSIFEISGKGERWKMYDLSQIGTSSQGTTPFYFKRKDKNYTLELKRNIDKGKKQIIIKEEKKLFKLSVGAGVAQLSYTTPSASAASTAPLLYTDITTEPYFMNIVAATSLLFAMPLTGQQHYNFTFGTGPRFLFGKSQFSILGEYVALGQEESETATSFSHSQMGLGLRYSTPMGAKSQLTLYLNYNGLGGDSTHMGMRIHYESLLQKGAWGVLFSYNMQSATSAISGNSSDFSQILALGTYSF